MKKPINLDVVRFIAALMIVAIHVYPFTCISENVDFIITRVLFRLAVPLFLMITGYYLLPASVKDKNKLVSYTKKLLKIYLFSVVFYLPINILNHTFKGMSFPSIVKMFFITGTMYHLWYFPALILGIWLTYFILKKVKKPVFLLTFLYIVGLLGDSYYGLIKNIPLLKDFYNILFMIFDYTRNGLFYVPLFLYIGYFVHIKKDEKKQKTSVYLFLFFILCMLMEGVIVYSFALTRHTSMYIFLVPSSYLLFNLIMTQDITQNKWIRSLGTLIYILHPIFIMVMHFITKSIQVEILNHSFINYLFILTMTIVCSSLILKIKEGIPYGKKERKF